MIVNEVIAQLSANPAMSERVLAAESLGRLDHSYLAAVGALTGGLADPEGEVRRACISALLSIWRSLNASPLLSLAPPEPEHDPDEMFAEVIPGLEGMLHDEDKYVRVEAAEALRNLHCANEEVLSVFVASAQDPDEYVRWRAAYSFWQGAAELKIVSSLAAPFLGGGRGPLPGVDTERVIAILIELVRDPSRDVREYAINAVGSIGPAASAAAEVLNQALQDTDEGVRFKAAGALARLGNAPTLALTGLLQGLTDPDRLKRKAAAFALAELGSEASAATDALIKALKDEEPRVRARCAKALGNIGPEVGDRAVHALLDLETDGEQIVRSAAARALDAIGREAVDAAHSRAASFRSRDAYPLLGFKAEDIPGLISMLHAPHADQRAFAVTALRLAPGDARAAIPDLILLLKDEDEDVRRRAAETLAALGH